MPLDPPFGLNLSKFLSGGLRQVVKISYNVSPSGNGNQGRESQIRIPPTCRNQDEAAGEAVWETTRCQLETADRAAYSCEPTPLFVTTAPGLRHKIDDIRVQTVSIGNELVPQNEILLCQELGVGETEANGDDPPPEHEGMGTDFLGHASINEIQLELGAPL